MIVVITQLYASVTEHTTSCSQSLLLDFSTQAQFAFVFPQNARVDAAKSACGSDSTPAIMTLTFDDDTLVLQFTKDTATTMFKLSSIVANLTHSEAHFPDSMSPGMEARAHAVPVLRSSIY